MASLVNLEVTFESYEWEAACRKGDVTINELFFEREIFGSSRFQLLFLRMLWSLE